MESSVTLFGVLRAAETLGSVYRLVGLQPTDLIRGEKPGPRAPLLRTSQGTARATGRWTPAFEAVIKLAVSSNRRPRESGGPGASD